MLTKDDEKTIEGIVTRVCSKMIKEAFHDFWFTMLEPYLTKKFDENDREHRKMQGDILNIKQDMHGIKGEISGVTASIKDHERELQLLKRL